MECFLVYFWKNDPMTSTSTTPEEYIAQLPADRKEPVSALRQVINKNLPAGFKETIGYGMLTWVIPFELYPAGYHCDPKQQLPFASLASQKNYISFYHMGVYADKAMLEWFTAEYLKATGKPPSMGKSCIRFKKTDKIPLALIGQLCKKISVKDWISTYEKNYKR